MPIAEVSCDEHALKACKERAGKEFVLQAHANVKK